ncbi:MAG: hypothetical protein ACERKD_06005 [Prolixibacteraceae bacterium]
MGTKYTHKEFLISSLKSMGFNIKQNSVDSFQLNMSNRQINDHSIKSKHKISIQYIESKIDENHHVDSRNNTPIKAIGCFNFIIPTPNNSPDFFVFSFNNQKDSNIEFIILLHDELMRRLSKFTLKPGNEIQVVFWLLPNGKLFETTKISCEAEWYYLSGDGAMATGTDIDYTEFLNNWESIKVKLASSATS